MADLLNHSDIIVIGGGAAGFFAAIQAKTGLPKSEVLLLEAAPRCLGKVRISGGGRCNVTHNCFDLKRFSEHYPRGQRELKGLLSQFGPEDTVRWFESRGVKLKAEADGRMFPVTDSSQTVIDCLEGEARKLGVKILTQFPVKHLERDAEGIFRLRGNSNDIQISDLSASALILTTGGGRDLWPWLKYTDHQLVEPRPSLFTFNITDPRLEGLAGVSFPHVSARLKVPEHKPFQQTGPLLIRTGD